MNAKSSPAQSRERARDTALLPEHRSIRDSAARPAREDEIPLISLAALNMGDRAGTAKIAEQIREACERIGFFYIVDHGVADDVISGAFDQAKRFFSQPLEFKQQVAVNAQQNGYRRSGSVQIPGNAPDVKEVFDIGVDLAADHPNVVAGKPLHGPNPWPELEGFREAIDAYFHAVRDVGYRMLPAFALALDLPQDYFLPYHEDSFTTMRVMRYPPTPPGKSQYGTAPHSDFGTITLLAQDGLGGLQVLTRSREWVDAPALPGSFVVNIGDLMACWTNDRFTSTPHRVINKTDQDRYSIPMFYNPSFDTVAECLPSCQGPDNPPRHPPIHYGDYVVGIFERIFAKE